MIRNFFKIALRNLVKNLAALKSSDFIRLLVISVLVAIPVAWLVMYNWLQSYAFRKTLAWWDFAAAAVLSILVALITVSTQAIGAATNNPVKSLRTE